MRIARSALFASLLLAACTQTDGAGKATAGQGQGTKASPANADGGDVGDADELPARDDLIREAPGVDVSKLEGRKLERFYTMLNSEASACAKPHSLAVSLRDDDACRDSMHVAQFLADSLAAGAQPSDIKAQADALVKALTPREIPIEGRPVYGNERAPVTLVVFADFQCPMCKAEAPELRAAIDEHKGRAKLVFKHFPLTTHHDRAEAAAIAAEAAAQQGLFWEMHDKLFGHQETLEDDDLERFAQEIGLDVEQWKADMATDEVKLAVAEDQKDGVTAEIQGTPTVYVNGREVSPMLWGGDLGAWIEDALRR